MNNTEKWRAIAQMPNGYAIEDSKGRLIAMTQCDEDENDDNPITWQEEQNHANLIAASPELLKAAQECQNLSDRCNNAMLPKSVQDLLKAINETLTTAINKATNKQ